MKTLLKVLLGLVAIIGVAIGAAFFLTADMKKSADGFFGAIKGKDYAGAYQQLSEEFRASTPQSDFVRFLERSALTQFKEASWSNRSVSGGRGELDGSVTTEGGGVVPIKLGFVKENGRWVIYSIHKPSAGLTGDASGKVPGESEQVALVKESIGVFARSVKAKDFSELHRHAAVLWQRQVSAERLAEAFKPFTERELDLTGLDAASPAFDVAPAIDDEGVLVIKGHYPTTPSRVLFQLKYVYEGVRWKLMGINVNVTPAG